MSEASEIVVYWRPGCGYCSSLFFQLDRSAVPYRRVNIYEDRAGAAIVRSAANGNETVPTVAVGAVMLVNPELDELLAVAVTQVPDAVPQGWEPPQPSRFARWLHAKLGGEETSVEPEVVEA
jgi:mycoredoxin